MSRFFSLVFLLLLVPFLALAQGSTPSPTPPEAETSLPRAPTAPEAETSQPRTPQRGVASVSAGIDAAAGPSHLQDFCQGRTFQRCVENIVGGAINVVLSLVGILLLGYTMYAGFLWMTSGGEKDRVEEAMKMIRQAIIGLLIVAFSFAISTFVITKLNTISQGQAASPPGATTTPPPTP